MAGDASSKRHLYHLHVELDSEYEPLQKRGKTSNVSRSALTTLRLQGKKNLDLWTDGSLYPTNPISQSTPPFYNCTSLLKFVADGYTGFLGYTHQLKAESEVLKFENYLLQQEAMQLKEQLKESLEKNKTLERALALARKRKTVLGIRNRERSLRNIENLKLGSGGCIRRIRAARSFLQPHKEKRDFNAAANHYSVLLPPAVITGDLFEKKRLRKAKKKCVEIFLRMNVLASEEVQKTMDSVGISRAGYSNLFNTLRGKLKESKLNGSLFPRPVRIREARLKINGEIMKMLGQPFHIQGVYQGKKRDLKFDEYNNIFFDLQTLQKTMIKFYNLSHEEAAGVAKFVIKLDESEILKNKKLERVSITLMNRALDAKPHEDFDDEVQKDSTKSFSVQSEQNIWWLGAFEVDSEDFDILKWVFHQTTIPEVIKSQQGGADLDVENFGKYKVEWHMAGDLKTLKCMYNVSKGASSKSPCLYCMQEAKDCKSSYWSKAPNRHTKDTKFQGVLDIPLTNVHICTLHALCRIVEKLVHLYIGFAFKLTPISARDTAVKRIEEALSEIGLHGGNVKIETDQQKSRAGNNVPRKPSIGGVKARRFLGFHGELGKINRERSESSIKWNMWKILHNSVKDHADDGNARNRKAQVWEALNDVFAYCDKRYWSDKDQAGFKKQLNKFKKAMQEAWTAESFTHYIHILYNHTPWFVKKYGSLSIWSTQGMEKSHYQARTRYFRHTRHGGGMQKANSLLEVFQWFYRQIYHRMKTAESKELYKQSTTWKAIQDQKKKKSDAYHASTARAKIIQWRANRYRMGRKWVLNEEHTDVGS